jgi:uncharacterized protein (TIRG00374 family)
MSDASSRALDDARDLSAPSAPPPPAASSAAPSQGGLGKKLLTGVLVGVVVYGAIVVVGGWKKLHDELAHFQWTALAIACALSLTNYGLRFLKWEYYLGVLGIRGVPKRESLLTFLSGFVLTITPGKVGEVFKSLVLFETRGVPMVRTAPIVVAERLTDLLGIIVLITVGSTAFEGGLFWAGLGAAVVLTLLVLVSFPNLTRALMRPLPKLPGALGRIGGRVVPKVEQGLVQLRELTTPARLVYPSLLSIAGWAIEGVGVWFILRGFGERHDLSETTFFYATATLAGALVPVPGGLGVTEKVLEQSMVRLGHVPHAIATATMLLGRLATLWFAVLVGFVALGILRLRYPTLLAGSRRPAPSGASVERPREE